MIEAAARELQPRAQRALANSPIQELRDLRVQEHQGTILLSGSVSSFYHKQLAQELLRALCRDHRIELINSIEVLDEVAPPRGEELRAGHPAGGRPRSGTTGTLFT